MLALRDLVTGAVTEVRPARRGQLRMCACGPEGTAGSLAGLRPFLLADLIRRNAERQRLAVIACAPPASAALQAGRAALNLLPPDYSPEPGESAALAAEAAGKLMAAGHARAGGDGSVQFTAAGEDDPWPLWRAATDGQPAWPSPWGDGVPGAEAACAALAVRFLGEVIDVHAGDASAPGYPGRERAVANALAGREAAGLWAGTGQAGADSAAGEPITLDQVTGRGLDPLAARLALLEHRYAEPDVPDWDALTAAGQALQDWRDQVAAWAGEPSKPISTACWAAFTAALDDDLNTPAALGSLRELAADAEVAGGSKFETFAAADRVLGLELVSLVGR